MRSTIMKIAAPTVSAADRDAQECALLKRTAKRDKAAFEALYRDYQPRLARFLSRLTQRRDLIDEVINDTLWVVWQKAGEFRGSSQVSTWIMGIAYRCTLKSLRQSGLGDQSLNEEDSPQFEPHLAQEERDWVAHGLRRLPLDQRMTLQLAYYSGHSLEEISEIMDCPVGTVKARMFHARVKLRNLLPALGGDAA